MADFSFSFDSDNPFAEPEAPKKAPADADNVPAPADAAPPAAPPAAPADTPADAASGADANAKAEDDAFSLDSLDFAFDDGVEVNDNLPTQIDAHAPTAPRQPTPGEAAFAEFDFNAPEPTEPATEPITEAPEAEAAEFDLNAPAADIEVETETDAPIAPFGDEVTSEFEMPDFDTPADLPETVEAPADEVVAEATVTEETPDNEVAAEAPVELEVPDFINSTETLQSVVETPVAETPVAETPIAETPIAAKDADESAPSDLEEFNALAFDLSVPDDEPTATDSAASESEIETDADADVLAATEVAFNTEPLAATDEVPVTEASSEAEGDDNPAEPVGEMSVPDAVAAAGSLTAAPASSVADAADEDASEVRLRKPRIMPRVAILGASGIGKNHARWFHQNGCHVVGFLGTSSDSTAQTESDLSAEFDFEGQSYTDLGELLAAETPDIVCVATPPPLHFSHVLQCLEAGAHVLCEKPLVYAPTRKFRENRDGAKELVKVAAKKNLRLGTQLQYGAATPILCKLAGLSATDVGDFAMELETVNPNSPADPLELWVDLGPHPISVAQMLAGADAKLAEDTIRYEPFQDDEKTEVLARFGINCADGRLLMVRAVVRSLRGDVKRKPRRRFSFNGHAVTYAPLQSAKGGFQAQFVAPDGYASVYSDPVNYLIGDFVRACVEDRAPLVTGDFGRENLEWMLKVAMPGDAR